MNLNTHLASSLAGSFDLLKNTIADMSDVELLQRPAPGANHANWQIGHLLNAEVHMLQAIGVRMPELPAGFAERYTKQTIGIDDPAKFATKKELLSLFEKVRAATIEAVRKVPAEQFDAKGPMPFTPTIADLYQVQAGHINMHVGQIQVLRRKLGKPILF